MDIPLSCDNLSPSLLSAVWTALCSNCLTAPLPVRTQIGFGVDLRNDSEFQQTHPVTGFVLH